jgi:hypothetical protein
MQLTPLGGSVLGANQHQAYCSKTVKPPIDAVSSSLVGTCIIVTGVRRHSRHVRESPRVGCDLILSMYTGLNHPNRDASSITREKPDQLPGIAGPVMTSNKDMIQPHNVRLT